MGGPRNERRIINAAANASTTLPTTHAAGKVCGRGSIAQEAMSSKALCGDPTHGLAAIQDQSKGQYAEHVCRELVDDANAPDARCRKLVGRFRNGNVSADHILDLQAAGDTRGGNILHAEAACSSDVTGAAAGPSHSHAVFDKGTKAQVTANLCVGARCLRA